MEDLEYQEVVGRVGADGRCPIVMSDRAICVATDHAHCAGCYATIRRDRVWCSEDCSDMVNEHETELQRDREAWAARRREHRLRTRLREALDRFTRVYDVEPQFIYVPHVHVLAVRALGLPYQISKIQTGLAYIGVVAGKDEGGKLRMVTFRAWNVRRRGEDGDEQGPF